MFFKVTGKREHLQSSSVAKKLRPGQPGTLRQMKRHGDALVCVRYRHDALKLYRFTTVEIVVDAAPIHRRPFNIASFGIRIGRYEHDLRRTLRAAGARCDPLDGLWWLRGSTIRELGLVHRICKI